MTNINKDSITFKIINNDSYIHVPYFIEYEVNNELINIENNKLHLNQGEYEIKFFINPKFSEYITFSSLKDVLIEVVDWDINGVKCLDFINCAKLVKVPDFLPSSITSTESMFYECSSFNQNINSWDVSNVTDMSYMFYGCTKPT